MGKLTRTMSACVLFCIVEYWYWTGVLLFSFAEGGAPLAGAVMLAQLLPAAILATPLGALGDRLPRGAALCGAYAAEAAALTTLAALFALHAPILAIVGASAVATVAVSVARPIHHAALPQLALTPERLVRSNAATGLADGIGVFVGPVLAGLLAQQFGYASVAACSAAAMAVAALLTARLHLPVSAFDSASEVDDSWLAGVRVVRADGPVFILLLMVGVAYVVMGSLEILNVGFATDVLSGDDSVSGLLIGAVGIGLFVGSLVAAGLAGSKRLAPVIIACYLAAGVPLLLMTLTGALPAAVVWLAICGLGLAVSSVAVRTLLQRTMDGRILGRVFAVQEALMMLGLALGAVIAPACLQWLAAKGSYAAVGLGLIVIAVVATPSLRRLDVRSVIRPDVLRAIGRVGFLSALRPPPAERLSQAAHWMDVPANVEVVRQGDPGDAFYVIESGRLSVLKDGRVMPYDLTQGDAFGELALLRDAPRSATVTSLEPCRLLRIERDDFLAAVTGVANGAQVARDVAAAFDAREAAGA